MVTRTRRLGAAAAAALIVGAFAAGPAGAQGTTENYVGSATAQALDLDLLGTGLTLGSTKAKVSSAVEALAEGAGQLLPPASATQSSATGTQSSGEKCGPISTPAELASILRVATACSSATTSSDPVAPRAASSSSVAAIDLSANTVLEQIPELNQTIDSVQGALTPVLGNLDAVTAQLGIKVSDTVGNLVDALQATQTAAVRAGNTTSEVITTGGAVTSVATAAGSQVDLLPVGSLTGAPLVSVVVGAAKATAVYDRVAGTSKASFDPALVRVITNLAGAARQEIAVAPGETLKLLEGTPLESEIIVANGSTVQNADGSVGAIADGVTLHLLKGINGGVRLALAHAEAGVAGSPAVQTVLETPRAAPELPRTGNNLPWLPVAGATLVTAAIVTRRFVLRTR